MENHTVGDQIGVRLSLFCFLFVGACTIDTIIASVRPDGPDHIDGVLGDGGSDNTANEGSDSPLQACAAIGGVALSPPGNFNCEWSHPLQDTSSTEKRVFTIDAANNFIIAGEFQGNLSLGGGDAGHSSAKSWFLAKIDDSGSHVWSKMLSGALAITDIASDTNGNVVITGHATGFVDLEGNPLTPRFNPLAKHESDLLVAKFSSNGNLVWSVRSGDGFMQGTRVGVDLHGNVIVTGISKSQLIIMPADKPEKVDGQFVAKFDDAGKLSWLNELGNKVASDPLLKMSIDPMGNVALAGSFTGKIVIGNETLESEPGAYDLFLAKIDPDGDTIWFKEFDGVKNENCGDVVTDTAGAIIMFGHLDNPVDFGCGPLVPTNSDGSYLVKFDGDGRILWSKYLDDVQPQQLPSRVMFAGYSDTILLGFQSVDKGPRLLLFTAEGDLASDGYLDGNWILESPAIPTNHEGPVFVVGNFANSLDVGCGQMNGSDEKDLFVAKFAH